jgi:hypothetical protein
MLELAVTGHGPFTITEIAAAASNRSNVSKMLAHASRQDAEQLTNLLEELFPVSATLMPPELRSRALRIYRSADNQHPGRWIRTPSVVESSSEGTVGGHNLGAKVTLLEADNEVAAGNVVVREGLDGQKVIHYNPQDGNRISGAVRDAARNEDMTASQVESVVERKLPTARSTSVNVPEGLGMVEGIHPDPLRGLQISHIEGGASYGWMPSGARLASSDAKTLSLLGSKRNQVLLVSRSSDGVYSVGTSGGRFIEARDQASAIDGLRELAAENNIKQCIFT